MQFLICAERRLKTGSFAVIKPNPGVFFRQKRAGHKISLQGYILLVLHPFIGKYGIFAMLAHNCGCYTHPQVQGYFLSELIPGPGTNQETLNEPNF